MAYRGEGRKRLRYLLPLLFSFLLLALLGSASPEGEANRQPEVQHLLPPPQASPETVRLVTFNVHYARDLPRLVESIRTHPTLRTADVLLLQEIESHPSEGASRAHKLAHALRLNYVYAPARATDDGGTHGLAILSRFPLSEVEVFPLKQYNLGFNTRQRIALAATLDVAGRPLRLYNVHLDTRINTQERIEQLRSVVEAARQHRVSHAVIGGDFNTNPFRWLFHVLPVFRSNQAKGVDEFMKESGFETSFVSNGSTSRKPLLRMRIDSLYSRGLRVAAFGVERSVDVSDHFPLWMDITWPPPLPGSH
ncbi:MAG: endonuclease/exonuclease/phosphatase family protein [Terriglobia bacterium]